MDKYKDHIYIYSALVDLCVAYGADYLQNESDNDNSWKMWDEASTTVDPLDNLSTGTNKLLQTVQTAMIDLATWTSTIINEPDPVISSQGSSTGIHIASVKKMDEVKDNFFLALIALDHLLLFSIAFDRFPPLQNKQFQSLKELLSTLNDEVGEQYLQDGWRLIPLNPGRNKCLEQIPQKNHYLFPWYGEWSDVPAESFDLLIEAMAGQAIDEAIISKERLIMLQVEVENDPDFLTMLAQQAVLAKEIPLAFQDAHALGAEQTTEPITHKETIRNRKTGKNWQERIKDFFSSFAIPQFATTAAMACLVVILVTVYRPDQSSNVPVMANLQLYGVTFHTNRAGEQKISRFEMQTGESLSSDDYFQINFSLEKDSFVTVLQQSDDDLPVLKFSGKVQAEEEVILPNGTQAFPLDKKVRVEKIYLLVGTKEIKNINAVLPKLKGEWTEEINKYLPGTSVKIFMFQH